MTSKAISYNTFTRIGEFTLKRQAINTTHYMLGSYAYFWKSSLNCNAFNSNIYINLNS